MICTIPAIHTCIIMVCLNYFVITFSLAWPAGAGLWALVAGLLFLCTKCNQLCSVWLCFGLLLCLGFVLSVGICVLYRQCFFFFQLILSFHFSIRYILNDLFWCHVGKLLQGLCYTLLHLRISFE